MPEVQLHGFTFEKWIKDTFFDGYTNKYSSKWDIPKEKNIKYGNLSISIKTAKYKSSIYFSDAIRQFSIDEDFILIVGFWVQENNLKRFVNVASPVIKISSWRKLWDPLTINDIQKYDKLIKDLSTHHSKVRLNAKTIKLEKPYCDCLITLNPKIDSKTQRRLQCSISFNKFFDELAYTENREIVDRPTLWGVQVPEPWESSGRVFHKRI